MSSIKAVARKAARRARRQIRTISRRRTDPQGYALAVEIRRRGLTFLEADALMDLRARARDLESKNVPGVLLEAGCALGGSAIMLAGSKTRTRPLEVYDVFGLIPPPGERDGADVHERYRTIAEGRAQGFDGETYYGYQPDLRQKVDGSFAAMGYPCQEHHVSLIEGLFEDTIRPSTPVALAHIDGDWYESVKVCLERIWPALPPGGVMVVDDYDAWSGCRTAVDEFLSGRPDCRVERWSRLHLIRR